jgi:hypothetical protein
VSTWNCCSIRNVGFVVRISAGRLHVMLFFSDKSNFSCRHDTRRHAGSNQLHRTGAPHVAVWGNYSTFVCSTRWLGCIDRFPRTLYSSVFSLFVCVCVPISSFLPLPHFLRLYSNAFSNVYIILSRMSFLLPSLCIILTFTLSSTYSKLYNF